MWDNIIIGSGNKGHSAGLALSLKSNASVSQNTVSFWISNAYLGQGMTIFKNTEEGRKLAELLKLGDPDSAVQEFLEDLVLKHLPAPQLKEAITRMRQQAFLDGKRAKAAAIRQALEL